MTESTATRLLRLFAGLIVTALVAVGCVGDDETTTAGADASADETEAGDASSDDTGDGADQGEPEPTDDDAATETTQSSAAADESTTSSSLVSAPDVDFADAPQVTVTDTGAEPRMELRTQIQPGQSESFVMTQTQEIKQEIDGETAPGVGAIEMLIGMDVDAESAGDGLLMVTSVVTSIAVGDSVDPSIAAQMEPALQGMIGLTTEAVLDDRGRSLSSELSGLEGIDPTIAASMEQMVGDSQIAQPLPEEAVGVGAQWQVSQNLDVSGVDIVQITNYELVSIDGPIVELRVNTEQRVPIGAELDAGGAVGTVLSWEAISSGTVLFDLSKMVPNSDITVNGVQEFEFGAGAQKSVLRQTINSQIEISPG